MEKARQGPTEPIVVATPHAPRMNLRYGAVLSTAEHHPGAAQSISEGMMSVEFPVLGTFYSCRRFPDAHYD